MIGPDASVPVEGTRDKILRKCRESVEMKFFEFSAERIELMCQEIAERFKQGRKLYVMGYGGSACDAFISPWSSSTLSLRSGEPCPPKR
jgi:hypothetical protein